MKVALSLERASMRPTKHWECHIMGIEQGRVPGWQTADRPPALKFQPSINCLLIFHHEDAASLRTLSLYIVTVKNVKRNRINERWELWSSNHSTIDFAANFIDEISVPSPRTVSSRSLREPQGEPSMRLAVDRRPSLATDLDHTMAAGLRSWVFHSTVEPQPAPPPLPQMGPKVLALTEGSLM
jgi:hypothetical protein